MYFITISAISFILFGIDKRKAKKHQRRVPESTLLILSFLGGSLGSILGMFIFSHKISKFSFWVKLLVVVAIQILVAIYAFHNFY